MSRVLIVDDEPAICWAFRECLTDEGFDVDVASSAEQALSIAQDRIPDAIVLDIRLPGMDGLDALRHLKSQATTVPVIIMTAFGSLSTAVRAIDGGAFDYLTKPVDLEKAVSLIRQAVDGAAAVQASPASANNATVQADANDDLLVGSSPAMQEVFRQIALVAERDVPVLITGESGTGKDLVARAIHQHSRRKGPFVPICIPALSDTVVESELFGHVRGAFTGADAQRTGLLLQADKGTAFVDEIGDIPHPLQVKLLRVLETREVQPVGTGQCIPGSFRLVAATNRRLEDMVAEGRFRSDLFYRLNVFRIELPPLRERRQDILLLAHRFLKDSDGNSRLQLSEAAAQQLQQRPWHGNVRELRNVIESASVVCRGEVICPEHLPPVAQTAITVPGQNTRASLDVAVSRWIASRLPATDLANRESATDLLAEFLTEAEPPLIKHVLELTKGNRALTARMLGIHRDTLREKLRRHNIDV